MKYLSDQLNKKAIIINKPNNNHTLIVKELDFLDLTDITPSKINNLLRISMDPDFVVFLGGKIQEIYECVIFVISFFIISSIY